MKQVFVRFAIRVFTGLITGAIGIAARIGPAPKPLPSTGLHVLLTGTFYSDNWIETHLRPMGQASSIARVTMVASTPVPELPGVEPVYASPRLVRLVGSSAARLLVFMHVAVRQRPDVIGGFHLLINGLLAILLARILRRKSLYFCGGGARELEGGGHLTENSIYRRLGSPSPYVEGRLRAAVTRCDFIITMGNSVKAYFLDAGAFGHVEVLPGGFDAVRFQPGKEPPKYDLVLVGRLSPVKRVDILLLAMKEIADSSIRAVVVGDGPSRQMLSELAENCGISGQVDFVGWQDDVGAWLRQSRIFVLTSDSEGLSQAMVQAMLCGLPAVVTHVGDLQDLVVDGANGYLIEPGNVAACAARIRGLLAEPGLRDTLGEQARADAARLSVDSVATAWDRILTARDR